MMIRAIAVSLFMAVAQPGHAQSVTAEELYRLADHYCVGPDGDEELTWALVARDGLTAIDGAEFDRLYLPGAGRQLRGWRIVRNDVELRVLTSRTRIRGGSAGATYFKVCWVSATPFERGAVDRQVQRETGIRGFRQEGARMFAWIPLANGTHQEVRLREWQRRGHAIAREEGMRMLLVNDYNDMTAVTYMTAADGCEDWCY